MHLQLPSRSSTADRAAKVVIDENDDGDATNTDETDTGARDGTGRRNRMLLDENERDGGSLCPARAICDGTGSDMLGVAPNAMQRPTNQPTLVYRTEVLFLVPSRCMVGRRSKR